MGKVVWGAAVVGIALLVGGCDGKTPTAAPRTSSSPSSSPTAVATATPVATASPSVSASPATVPSPTASATPHTFRVGRKPVTASGHLAPGYRVVQRLNGGHCSSGSDVLARAYRCFAENYVVDPCWRYAAPAPTLAVMCLPDPLSHNAVEVVVDSLEPLTGHNRIGGEFPWGLRLSNGMTCVAEQGAHDQYRGRVIDYSCGRGKDTLLRVLRGLHREQPVWTADTTRWDGRHDSPGPRVTVTTAVYGRD